MASTLQRILANVGAVAFGTLTLAFGFAALSMIVAMVTHSDQKLTIADIIFAIAITLLNWWLTRMCWRSRTPKNSHPAPKTNCVKHPTHSEIVEFYSKVVGTSHRNSDGTSRQAAISKHCFDGAPLDLIREPDNKHDRNAIAVFYNDKQIGYLSADIVNKYAPKLDDGSISMKAAIDEITGGYGDKSTLGVNITLSIIQKFSRD